MRIEEGKFYRSQNGRDSGLAVRHDGDDGSSFFVVGASHYTEAGLYSYRGRLPRTPTDSRDGLAGMDLEGASVGPVRTVTRKEIVPGVYGAVHVENGANGDRVQLRFVSPCDGLTTWYSADELRAAATVLNELADALSEAKGSAEG